MRWEYEQPRSKLFISDGKEVWFYVPGEADARRARVKKLDDLRSPLRYLLGKTHLEKEFRVLGAEFVDYEGTSFSSSPIVTILSAVPKGMEGQIRGVELGLNLSSQIVFIRIHETDGSTTEFRFADIVEDAPAPENLFHFSPPPGVGVISSEDLAP